MALSTPRLRAAKMVQILSCEVCDIGGLGHSFDQLNDNLGWYRLGDQSLTYQGIYLCFYIYD